MPDVLANLALILADGPEPVMPARWTGESLIVAFDTTTQAAEVALLVVHALGETPAPKIAAHYAIAQRANDPFSDKPFMIGRASVELAQIAATTPSGAIHVSEDFAATLHIASRLEQRQTEYVGELPAAGEEEPLQLFSLRR